MRTGAGPDVWRSCGNKPAGPKQKKPGSRVTKENKFSRFFFKNRLGIFIGIFKVINLLKRQNGTTELVSLTSDQHIKDIVTP